MIALITSCINPFRPGDKMVKSFVNVDERFDETVNTINKLQAYPFSALHLIDNSYQFDFNRLSSKFDDELKISHFQQYQFINKGINELLMLLAIVDDLPDNEAIFKISGRYFPNAGFVCDIADNHDFKILSNNFYSKKGTISTRAYFAADKVIYKEFLLKCLNEVFIYPQRIVGFRSAVNAVKQVFKPLSTTESNTAIEFAAARVLKTGNYRLQLVTKMGIEGKIAGFESLNAITE